MTDREVGVSQVKHPARRIMFVWSIAFYIAGSSVYVSAAGD